MATGGGGWRLAGTGGGGGQLGGTDGGGGRLAGSGEEHCFRPRCALVTRRTGPGPLMVSLIVSFCRVGRGIVSVSGSVCCCCCSCCSSVSTCDCASSITVMSMSE